MAGPCSLFLLRWHCGRRLKAEESSSRSSLPEGRVWQQKADLRRGGGECERREEAPCVRPPFWRGSGDVFSEAAGGAMKRRAHELGASAKAPQQCRVRGRRARLAAALQQRFRVRARRRERAAGRACNWAVWQKQSTARSACGPMFRLRGRVSAVCRPVAWAALRGSSARCRPSQRLGLITAHSHRPTAQSPP
jgi:hypothetical protein